MLRYSAKEWLPSYLTDNEASLRQTPYNIMNRGEDFWKM